MTDASNRNSLKVVVAPVYLMDDRRVNIARWMLGNTKLGPEIAGVYSYSRLPGRERGTCPGSTEECEEICYAKRIVNPHVLFVYAENSERSDLPPLPENARFVRIHVSGDFDSPTYIESWIALCREHPDVRFWGYTRSWRVPTLAPLLEQLRDLHNVQLFASVDESSELPPAGWRRAWIDDDQRLMVPPDARRESLRHPIPEAWTGPAYVCPEETGRKANCVACGYCIRGQHGDVVFLRH